jgi:tetratricopeptide (TPR) repeat protein
MNDIREILDHQLRQSELDVMDIVPIPMHGDRMVRLRTLEEALEDHQGEDAVSYLIQIKPRRQAKPAPQQSTPSAAAVAATMQTEPAPPHRPSAATASATGENIYQQDGKLNIPYLARNAELLLAAQDYAFARNIYKAILSSGERTGMALFGIGRCDEAEGRLDDARTSYEESIAYHPTLESYHRLSSVLMIQKKDQLAAEVLERALNLKEIETRTRFELHKACGNSWTRARGHDQAQRHFEQALDIDPAADDIRANLGALYLQSQRTDEARRNFEDALASNPRNEKALTGLASCYLVEGDKRRAHDMFAKTLEIDLNNPTAIYHLVKCAYEIRSYATAARVVEEYIQIAPVNVNLLYSLAGLQFHLSRTNDARTTARQILALNAEHGGAKELLNLIDRFAN